MLHSLPEQQDLGRHAWSDVLGSGAGIGAAVIPDVVLGSYVDTLDILVLRSCASKPSYPAQSVSLSSHAALTLCCCMAATLAAATNVATISSSHTPIVPMNSSGSPLTYLITSQQHPHSPLLRLLFFGCSLLQPPCRHQAPLQHRSAAAAARPHSSAHHPATLLQHGACPLVRRQRAWTRLCFSHQATRQLLMAQHQQGQQRQQRQQEQEQQGRMHLYQAALSRALPPHLSSPSQHSASSSSSSSRCR